MTDVLSEPISVPSRLGVTATYVDGELRLALQPYAEVLHHGAVRASVLAFMIDVVAGVILDDEAEVWTLTSDMTVRMRPMRAPTSIHTRCTILRRGRRSATCMVDLFNEAGDSVAVGAIGFAKVPRQPSDPPKPRPLPEHIAGLFNGTTRLSRPLRQEAGIVVLDPKKGVVEVPVTRELRNPAGTLQGAMVALVAEAAAEELIASRFDVPAVVTELDLRYLAKTTDGPVRTRVTLLGDGPDAPMQIELVDHSSDRLTTLVYARAAIIP